VIVVLLNVARTWAMPSAPTRFVLRRRPAAVAAGCCRVAILALLRCYFFTASFFPAIAIRGPLRVRALVCVL
jgi:hypothetical protein